MPPVLALLAVACSVGPVARVGVVREKGFYIHREGVQLQGFAWASHPRTPKTWATTALIQRLWGLGWKFIRPAPKARRVLALFRRQSRSLTKTSQGILEFPANIFQISSVIDAPLYFWSVIPRTSRG